MKPFSKTIVSMSLGLMLTGCGGGDDVNTSSGAGGNVMCSAEQIAGVWRVNAEFLGRSETRDFTLDGSELTEDGSIRLSQDGFTLTGSFDASCRSASGSIRQSIFRGSWNAVKL